MPYEDPDTRFPLIFHPFNDALNKDHDVMMAIITPRAIPVNFFGSGKASNLAYEFYNPSALARQLAFDQLPIALCYADVPNSHQTPIQMSFYRLGSQLSSSLRHTSSGGESGKNTCSTDRLSHTLA